MKNKKQTKMVVPQVVLAILASLMCACLIYGYSGLYINDTISGIMVQFMTIGVIILAVGSIAMSIFVGGKMRWIWIAVSVITVIAIAILIHELSNMKFQF